MMPNQALQRTGQKKPWPAAELGRCGCMKSPCAQFLKKAARKMFVRTRCMNDRMSGGVKCPQNCCVSTPPGLVLQPR